MRHKSLTPILNVSDVPASVLWFEKLGFSRSFTWNEGGMIEQAALSNDHGPARFAGVCATSDTPSRGTDTESIGLFLCQDGQGSRDPRPAVGPDFEQYGGTWMSWWVTDVDAAHAECQAAGIEIVKPPVTEPWGIREFLIRHPDGHFFRVSGAAK